MILLSLPEGAGGGFDEGRRRPLVVSRYHGSRGDEDVDVADL